MLIRLVMVLCVLIVAVATGCGGDDEETAAAPTMEEFIAQADEICAEGDAQINQAAQETFTERPSPEEEEQFITEEVIPGIQQQIDGISELTPPEGSEDQINEFLDTAQAALDEAEQDPSILTQQGGGENPFAETAQLGQEIGFENCAQGG